ncbi:uncharacterized protein LOC141714401 [Apium graveolens]|uniref:uncharacterized protein LOC141714401 n=1 Tax=Apium graveolens TaxID=4045 RepID=UPI003D7A5C4C
MKDFNHEKREMLGDYIGELDSAHMIAVKKYENLLKQKNHNERCIVKKTARSKIDYKTRVSASFESVRYLLQQGLAFRGHNESSTSKNQGKFLKLIKVLARNNVEINRVVLDNAPKNQKMVSPEIQNDLTYAATTEIGNLIVKQIDDDYFAILVDESRDISSIEKLAIILRYVDTHRHITERFLGITRVKNTKASTLKIAIEAMLLKCGLNISNLRE